MPTVVLPRPRAPVKVNTGAAIGEAISTGLQTALSVQQMMFLAEQRKREAESADISKAQSLLGLTGGDPNALPRESQQTIVDAFGLEGLKENPETGKLEFPVSAQTETQQLLEQFKLEQFRGAQEGDPTATSNVRKFLGLEAPSIDPAELDIKREAIEVRREANSVARAKAIIQQQTDIAVEKIRRGSKDDPSGAFKVGTNIFTSQDNALEFVQDRGISTDEIQPLSIEAFSAVLDEQKDRLDIREKQLNIRKAKKSLREQDNLGVLDSIIDASRSFREAGDLDNAQKFSKVAGGLVRSQLERDGVDVSALRADESGFFSTILPKALSLTDPIGIKTFLQGFDEVQGESPEPESVSTEGIVGFDFATGETISQGGLVPFSPEKKTKGPGKIANRIVVDATKEQLQIAINNNIPLEDAKQQIVADIMRNSPGTSFEQAATFVNIALQELVTQAAGSVR